MIKEFNVITRLETTRDCTLEELAHINDPERIKASTNANIQAQIAALEAEITTRVRNDLLLRPNIPITRPNSAVKTPKKPLDFITDIDSQIESLRTTLQP